VTCPPRSRRTGDRAAGRRAFTAQAGVLAEIVAQVPGGQRPVETAGDLAGQLSEPAGG
jgi:hypothetical protein